MRSSQVKIDSPCHESWEAMEGGAERRFCGVCQKDVHDLSAMGVDEAHALLRRSSSESLCVRYTAEPDGALRFRDLVPSSRLTRGLVRAAFAAAMLAACTPGGAPISDVGDAVIESIRAQTVATPDGGCDHATGPFTTFHLPPGHTLCPSAGDEPMTGRPIEIVSAPPSVDPLQARPDPLPIPMMGAAIAAPEPSAPLVPCDPPTYVPPPPVQPESQPPVRMGDVVPKRAPQPPPRPKMGGLTRSNPPEPEVAPAPGFAPPPGPASAIEVNDVDGDRPARMGRIARPH